MIPHIRLSSVALPGSRLTSRLVDLLAVGLRNFLWADRLAAFSKTS